MADSSLSVRDRELFLAEPHVAALSVSAGQDRGPFTVPIWYQYAPGGEAWVLTEAGSRKTRLIRTAGRFTLMVERVMPTVRYVSVEGPVTRIVPGTEAHLRESAERYLPPDKVPAYIEFVEDLGEQVAIYLRPERWLTADLGPGDIPPGALPGEPERERVTRITVSRTVDRNGPGADVDKSGSRSSVWLPAWLPAGVKPGMPSSEVAGIP